MAQKVYTRRTPVAAVAASGDVPKPIALPSTDPEEIKADSNTFVLDRFTADDAWDLGNLLYTRLRPFATVTGKPTLISIALANSQHVLFQAAVGSGTAPDNAKWVQRKRNTALRFGCSSWFMGRKFNGDEEAFQAKYGLSPEEASNYAIHGGAVPILVRGVEGPVAVVVVSGLKQEEDHGVIAEVIRENWTAA